MRMPRVPRDRKEMVQVASYGSSEVSKDEGVGNHEGVQVGEMRAFRQRSKNGGALSQGLC